MIQYNKLSDIRRSLMLRFIKGYENNETLRIFLYNLQFFYSDRCDVILKWLIFNNITGRQFISYLRENNVLPAASIEGIKLICRRMGIKEEIKTPLDSF